jgi:hypothetical protein
VSRLGQTVRVRGPGGGGGEGPWYGSGCNGYVWLATVAEGDTYVVWGSFSDLSISGDAGHSLERSGGGLWRLVFTAAAEGVNVATDSCTYSGLTMHRVLGGTAWDVGFALPTCS